MDDLFDLEKLRQNWSRATPPASEGPVASLAGVAAAPDPLREARTFLAELERAVLPRFPHGALAFQAMLRELQQGLDELDATPSVTDGHDRGAPPASASPPPDAVATIGRLQKTLDNVEELIEVFFMQEQAGLRGRS